MHKYYKKMKGFRIPDMKEKIYTIPINEAYDTPCECPLCLLERKIEQEAVEYALGAAMMEPDYRVLSNEKGYCRKHFEQMFKKPNKLSLALVLDTYLEETRKEIEKYRKQASSIKNSSGLFKKNDAAAFCDSFSDMLEKKEKSCIVCDKINYTMDRYVDVLLDMWATELDFKSKFEKSLGLCLPHMRSLIFAAPKKLSKKDCAQFVSGLVEKQCSELGRIQEDIHRFTLKFDYRNRDMDWGNAKDAPLRTIEKVAGFISFDE